MPLKILGSLLILTSCGLAGFSMAGQCSRRPGELRNLQSLLELFANEVRYLANPLADAFERISGKFESPVEMFFKEAAAILRKREGMNSSEAWDTAIRKHEKMTALTKEDMDVLHTFGEMLGKSDMDGQLRSIELAIARLKIQEREAEEKRTRNEGMYKKLGVLMGLVIVILLF